VGMTESKKGNLEKKKRDFITNENYTSTHAHIASEEMLGQYRASERKNSDNDR
jgi:hypothetical protein